MGRSEIGNTRPEILLLDSDPNPDVETYFPELLPISSPDSDDIGLPDRPEAVSSQAPNVEVRVKVDRQPSRIRRAAIGAGMLIVAVVAAGYAIKDRIPGLPQVVPESQHELEVEITDVETEFVFDKTIKFADIESSFEYNQHTSLDRQGLIIGASNCDVDIEDEITTGGIAEVLISEAVITKEGNKATIEVTGDVTASSKVDVTGGIPEITPASGGVDMCRGTNEIDWANRIAYGFKDKEKPENNEDGTLKNAGEIAAACAIQAEGRGALDQAIIYQAGIFSEKLEGISPDNITVKFQGDFDEVAINGVDSTVADFYRDFNEVAEKYGEETDAHDEVELNVSELVDCDEHEITVTQDKLSK
jgi:hypothetical protein